MKKQLRLSVLLAFGLAAVITQGADARVISTFDPGGADAELREAQPNSPRGTNPELGMRLASPDNPALQSGSHNGHVYLKFGIGSVTTEELNHPITVRTTWMLSNLNPNRIFDEADLVAGDFQDRPRVSFDYFVLNPNHARADWNEATMVYGGPGTVLADRAPGVQWDGNVNTKDLLIDADNLTFLGNNVMRSLARDGDGPDSNVIENRIPLGEPFDITFAPGSPLHNAIVTAQGTTHQTVTIVANLAHDNLTNMNTAWQNHNYVWNSRDKNPLNVDTGYDSDTTDPDNPLGSPWSGAENTAANPFAPQLILGPAAIPEPATVVLFALSGVAMMLRRSS